MNYTPQIKYAILTLLCLLAWSGTAQSTKFKVALDAGHGGKDFGATSNYIVEKTVALNVALKVGKILENTSGIEVVYTRKSDVFIDILERADVANRADASILVSLHCNANANTTAFGTETYVVGPAKNISNIEAAKRENAVIVMERDHAAKYDGFDPYSAQDMQKLGAVPNDFTDSSIILAGKIENNFADDLDRKSRGVKQGPYMLLHKAFMPAVLIELGFISNDAEGEYLDSEKGQQEIARAIAAAIISYKKEHFDGGKQTAAVKPSSKVTSSPPDAGTQNSSRTTDIAIEQTPNTTVKSGVVFKVQISASGKKLDLTPENFRGLTNLSVTNEGGTLYKYMYGETSDYETARKYLTEARSKGFDGAYVVAFRDGKKIKLDEALR